MFISEKDRYLPIEILSSFRESLKSQGYSTPTVKNYVADTRHVILWIKQNYQEFRFEKINGSTLVSYRTYLKETFRSKPSIAARRLSSLRKFLSWAAGAGLVAEDLLKTLHPLLDPREILVQGISPTSAGEADVSSVKAEEKEDISNYKPYQKILHHIRKSRPDWYRRYHQKDFAHTLHLVILIFYILAIGSLVVYTQFLKPQLGLTQDNLSRQLGNVLAATSPPSVLSFQGRLTDSSSVPVTSSSDIVFTIYDAETGGSLQWTSKTWAVTPDQNGIFSVCLGNQTTSDDCLLNGVADTPFPATLFTDNAALYLQVSVEGETLTPRQRIASVSYALNSDALEGFHGSQSPGANQVPVLNGSGNLAFAGAASITTGSGNLTIDSAGTFVVSDTIAANAGTVTSSASTFNLINSTPTTVNFAGAATALTIGATTGTATIRNATTGITGLLDVNGGDGSDFAGGVTFNDDVTFTHAGTENIDVTNSTLSTTAGLLDMNLATGADGATGINIDYDIIADSSVLTYHGIYLSMIADASFSIPDYVYGLTINFEDGSGGHLGAFLNLNNAGTGGSEKLPDGIIITAATGGGIEDAIDVSDADIDNALNAGDNFLLFNGIRAFSASSTNFTFEDTSGNDLVNIIDNGTNGRITIPGYGDFYQFAGLSLFGVWSGQANFVTGTESQYFDVNSDDGCSTCSFFIRSSTSATLLMDLSLSNLSLNLDDTTNRTQRLCHSGSNGATGLVDVSDCQASGQADFAEYYGSDGSLSAADLVTIDKQATQQNIKDLGASSKAWVKKTTKPYDESLIGIVSTNPYAEILGEGVFKTSEHPKPVALAGRVPVKVSGENGDIKPGDPLTSSSTPGVAMKATKSGPIIGKALQSFECGVMSSETNNSSPITNNSCRGKIIVFVSTGWYVAPLEQSSNVKAQMSNLSLETLAVRSISTEGISIGDHSIGQTDDSDLSIKLDQNKHLEIRDFAGEVVAWISDKGEAAFKKVTALAGDFQKLVFGELAVKADSQVAGEAEIKVDESEVFVESDKVAEESLIYITSTTETNGQTLYLKEKSPDEGFTVSIEHNQTSGEETVAEEAIKFNWLIINKEK